MNSTCRILTPVERINRHLSILGYAGSNLHLKILKWNNTNGSEWTVERLKTLKLQFIHILANQPFDKGWIAYRGNLPRGPFGTLFRLGIKKPKICLAVLNSYMAYTNPSLKKKEDVFRNITKPMTPDVQKFVNEEFFNINLSPKHRMYGEHLFNNELSLENIQPSISTSLNTAKPFTGKGDIAWIESLRNTSRKILPTEGISCHFYDKNTFDMEEYGGELIVLPERGNKARVIALPHAELQIYFEPMHKVLNKILLSIPEDCTHSQIEGALYARQELTKGKIVHSVDLSAATDRFPLKLQMGLLRKLNKGPHNLNWASFFERTSRLLWKSEFGDIVYGAGQPMGLYGSFALFALTHHAVLQTLIINNGIPINLDGTRPYRILGDDIIISDSTLCSLYKEYMEKLGVDISPSKTISSTTLAEFAGFIVTKGKLIKAAKPVLNGMTVDSIINYIKTMNKNPFTGRFKEIGDLLQYLPSPYGAGLNPSGLSQQSRLDLFRSEEITEKVLSCSNNIDNHLFAKRSDLKYWNPYLKRYVNDGTEPEHDVVLNYFASVASDIRTELSELANVPGDSRLHREHLLNNHEQPNKIAYVGSLGQQHRVVAKPEYISSKIRWYKKLFGFYPWKT